MEVIEMTCASCHHWYTEITEDDGFTHHLGKHGRANIGRCRIHPTEPGSQVRLDSDSACADFVLAAGEQMEVFG